jgi:NAD-dependent deacetylase
LPHVPARTRASAPGWAHGVRRLAVLTGAGISTDSGIPDFRGPSGTWTLNPGAQKKHTYQAFLADIGLRRSYWKSRYEHPAWCAKPNAGHLAVAALANSAIDTTVVTQNTDGLQQRAGTPPDRVIELHGTMHEVICVECGHRSPTARALARIGAGEAVPPCLRCGGILKTASTMFGQTMSPSVFARAEHAVTSCDLLLVAGTTLAVEPAGSLCASAVRAGAALVIINWDRTPYDGIATEIIRDPLSEALPRIVRYLLATTRPDAERPGPGACGGSRRCRWGPRPSQLLRAQARTARIRSRTGELERLTAWCAGAGARTHLVSGPAGAGKSRLAFELADRLAGTGKWDVEFLAPHAHLPLSGQRPLLAIVDDAETRQDHVARIMRAASAGPLAAPVRVLLLAGTRDGWWDRLRSEVNTSEELAPPDNARSGHADAVRDAADDYADALTTMGFPCSPPDRAFLTGLAGAPDVPGALQASVLAGLLGLTGHAEDQLPSYELAFLQRAAEERELELPAEAVACAVASAILCGAADEKAALTALGHIPALQDANIHIRAARWLRDMYPPAASGQSPYWDESLPDPLTEELLAAVVTPQFLMGMLMETTEEQDRRALAILARAAATRPGLRVCLIELLSVLPGLSPAAVAVALSGGYPAPLVAALTSLAENAALPAELLQAIPAGTTVLGEFPVLLAESLVEAYEQRAEAHPESGSRGRARMLIELAERLADLGRAKQAHAVAQRAVDAAGRLAEPLDYPARAAESLRRAAELARREREHVAQAQTYPDSYACFPGGARPGQTRSLTVPQPCPARPRALPQPSDTRSLPGTASPGGILQEGVKPC